MADNHNHFHENGSREFSDEAIRRFLLGALSAAEQPLFEQRLITDDALDARVLLTEYQLADDYAFERLNAADRKLFEEYYLASGDRKQTLLVSSALRDRFGSAGPRQGVTIRERLRSQFTFHQPVLRFAFGLLILSLLIGTAWLVTKELRIAKRFIPRRAPVATPSPAQPSSANHPTNATSTPVHTENSPTMPAHEPEASAIVSSFVLSPNRREAATIPVVNLPKDKPGVVRFQLALQPNPLGSYQAELMSDDGQSVFSAKSLTADGFIATIDFDVPAGLLKTGNYQIELRRGSDGSRENVVSYYFLVQVAD